MAWLNTHNKIANWTALLFLIVAAAVALPVAAQMYMWKDPETGQTKMSNVKPPWYGSNQPGVRGPRTQVFLNGNLVDDTEGQANPEQRARVNARLEEAARQQAEAARLQQQRMEQARQQTQRADLARQQAELEAKKKQAASEERKRADEAFKETIDRATRFSDEEVRRGVRNCSLGINC
jgi:signal transduction histidine kinase